MLCPFCNIDIVEGIYRSEKDHVKICGQRDEKQNLLNNWG